VGAPKVVSYPRRLWINRNLCGERCALSLQDAPTPPRNQGPELIEPAEGAIAGAPRLL
jgi:hypothetical protein